MDMKAPKEHTPHEDSSRWQQWLYGWFGKAPLSGAPAAPAKDADEPAIPVRSFRFGDGKAPAFLILGLTGTPREMKGVVRGLAARRFRCYRLRLSLLLRRAWALLRHS